MRNIKIFDTTLRDGEQSPGCSMNLNEKLKVARQLARLNVDFIEAGFAVSSPGDFESVRRIAEEVRGVGIASLARCVQKDIDAAAEALREAEHPRIHVFLATSPLHMQYKLHMSPEQVLESIERSVAYARNLCADVEFSATSRPIKPPPTTTARLTFSASTYARIATASSGARIL